MVKGVNFGVQMVDFMVMVQSQIWGREGWWSIRKIGGNWHSFGIQSRSRINRSFFDFSEQFQFEGWALHPLKVIHAEMRPSEGGWCQAPCALFINNSQYRLLLKGRDHVVLEGMARHAQSFFAECRSIFAIDFCTGPTSRLKLSSWWQQLAKSQCYVGTQVWHYI